MSHLGELARCHAAELRAISGNLPERFAEAGRALESRLGEAGLRAWARIGLGLARSAPRSPDVAVAFFEASRALGRLDVAAFSSWAEIAAGLADRAPGAAAAFLAATPGALAHLRLEQLGEWARQGRALCRGGWKSTQLAARFFRLSPDLLAVLSLPALARLADIVGRLAQRSEELASVCLQEAWDRIARLSAPDREPFLVFVQAMCSASWVDAQRCFDRGPELLEVVQPDPRSALLGLATAAVSETGCDAFRLFVAAAEALGALEPAAQAEVVDFARRLAPHGRRAALESVASAPAVHSRLTSEGVRRWSEIGLELLAQGQPAERAESYFRIESTLAQEMLAELAGRLELGRVGSLLRLYAKALTGESLLVQPTDALVRRNIGWASASAPTTDGISIFLPPAVDLFGDRDANFQVYKVYTLHQVGRLEFGSFRYRFGAGGSQLRSTVLERERQRLEARGAVEAARSTPLTPMQRLFDLFDDRGLAAELFALVEAVRIDACVRREYPGTRRWLARLQQLEAERRAEVRRMPLRQAFVENLVRASLNRADAIRWPEELAARLERAVATLRLVEQSGATVEDSAEAGAVLYDLAMAIPNLPPQRLPADWRELNEEAVAKAAGRVGAALPAGAVPFEGEDLPYESPGHPGYRGDFKPELVQLLEELGVREGTPELGSPLTREEILELLERSVEIERTEETEAEAGDLDALLANIEREAADRAGSDDEPDAAGGGEDAEQPIEWFRYDEWDFRANDYRPGWCRVGERVAAEGDSNFYGETLQRYHGLVLETRLQFERMRPESFRRLKRLEDGHDIDLDQAIQFQADKQAGAGPLARFYTRRNKVKRDVAVAFLLDMSGSTGEELRPSRLAASRAPTSSGGEKRIIDIERESTVLMVEALEAIGDAYGLYGFSGHGRENVEFHVIKHLDEAFDSAVRRRIGRIEPIRSTRMGPAIRHAVTRLNEHDAKTKILILVSDGRPQDEEYGRDRGEKEYAVHDTKRALLEAKRQGITPFLITVDGAGHDYLRYMCDDMGYEVVADIESLPRRLPKLYRHLAAE